METYIVEHNKFGNWMEDGLNRHPTLREAKKRIEGKQPGTHRIKRRVEEIIRV